MLLVQQQRIIADGTDVRTRSAFMELNLLEKPAMPLYAITRYIYA